MMFFCGVFITFIYSLRLFIRVINLGAKSLFEGHVRVIMMVFSFVLVLLSVLGLW